MALCATCLSAARVTHYHANKEAKNATQRAWRERNPERRRLQLRRWRIKKYGMTVAEFDTMLLGQDGRCAVRGCRTVLQPGRHTHIDHDHATGRVRGILCHDCNRGIGLLRENPERLRGAAEYLERGKTMASAAE